MLLYMQLPCYIVQTNLQTLSLTKQKVNPNMYSSLNPSPNISPNPDSIFDEKQWVIYIQRTLDEELKEDTESLVHIFNVPKLLMALNPYCYVPQVVAIGPYHCTRPEIRDTERYKLAAANRFQRKLHDIKLQQVVENLVEMEPKIRACYHSVLSYGGETLGWMMVLDASFLLEFLQFCGCRQVNTNAVVSTLWHLVSLVGNKTAQNMVLRDISMLENQIPLFVLRKLLEVQFSSLEEVDEMLFHMLMGYCEEVSPFKMDQELNKFKVRECAHALDVLYHFCVPKVVGFSVEEVLRVIIKENEDRECLETFDDCDRKKLLLRKVWIKICNVRGRFKCMKKMISSKPVKVILTLPLTCLCNLPILKVMKEPMENFIKSLDEEEKNDDDGSSKTSSGIINKPPLLEEITIPSVTELAKAGVCFRPTTRGISTTAFDDKNFIFYLPTITIDANTEVILRNLVAYEACIESGPLILARYIELMNGIIDTEEDAKFLRQRGIIVNCLKSDEEVANLWNGMTKCIRLTKVPFLDKVIEDVNRYYNGRLTVKVEKSIKRYVFGSWRLLTFFACILMLLLMGLQAFCSVYSCARVGPFKKLG